MVHQPLIDLRTRAEFVAGHLKDATHLPWPDLQARLNELPARPALLSLMGCEADCLAAQSYLIDKGYQVQIELDFQAKLAQKSPGLVIFGAISKPLWQPSPLIKEWITRVKAQQDTFQHYSVLDLGCGGGRDAVYLALQGCQVTGIEHKPAVLQRAQHLAEQAGVNVDFKACDVTLPSCFSTESQWDLLVCVRFLNRALLPIMRQSIKPGGWIVFQTFSAGCEVFGSPKNPNFILKPHELNKVFADFNILVDRIDFLPDGRPLASFIAQKKG